MKFWHEMPLPTFKRLQFQLHGSKEVAVGHSWFNLPWIITYKAGYGHVASGTKAILVHTRTWTVFIYQQISLVSNIHFCWYNHSKKRNIHVSSAQDKKACTEKSVGSFQFSMHGKKWLSSVWSHEKRGCLSCERLMSECSKQSSELNFLLEWFGDFWPIFYDLPRF